ncbi:MAG: universal stress protein [Trueperaceae bacterium]
MTDLHLLVPLDGSDLARSALDAVTRTFGPERAHVTLLRVASAPGRVPSSFERRTVSAELTIPEAAEANHVYASQEWDATRQRLRDELEVEARKLESDGWKVQVRTAFGDPAEEIVRVAEEEGASLIAMATHGRSGLTRALAGSVAERTVRTSPVPVLVVRPSQARSA